MLSGCFVCCQQPVEMFRLKSGTPSKCVNPKTMCVCVFVFVNLSESLSGSCAVWMFRLLSAACRDVSS